MPYAIFDKSVEAKDKCKVPNFNKIKKFRTYKSAEKYIEKHGYTNCRPLKVNLKKRKC